MSGLCYSKSLVLIAGPGLCYTVTDIFKRIIINILEHHSYSCFQKSLQNYSKMLLFNLYLLSGNAPFKQGIGNIALAFLGTVQTNHKTSNFFPLYFIIQKVFILSY